MTDLTVQQVRNSPCYLLLKFEEEIEIFANRAIAWLKFQKTITPEVQFLQKETDRVTEEIDMVRTELYRRQKLN